MHKHTHHTNIHTHLIIENSFSPNNCYFVFLANKPDKKLGLFYLVNDVVQNGRRKAKDLVTAFGGVLLEALPLLRFVILLLFIYLFI